MSTDPSQRDRGGEVEREDVDLIGDPIPPEELLRPLKASEGLSRNLEEVNLVGDPIPADELVEPKIRHARTLEWLTKALVVGFFVSLACSFGVSLGFGQWVPLSDTWVVAGPIIGALVGYYFKRDSL